jgi:hypothetical protein
MKMNLGIYVKSLSDEQQIKLAVEAVETGIDNNKIDDASIFFDSVGFTPFFFSCGLFNSTEMWNFSGKMITFSLDCLKFIKDIVNDIEVYYCYGYEKDKNTLRLLDLTQSGVNIISKTKEDSKEYYRLTGKKCVGCLEDDSLLNIIG